MKTKTTLIFAAALLLVSCSGGEVKNTLGINKKSPDEFMVISRPPLSVPPDFTLRAPGNGYSNDGDIAEQAKNAVLNSKSSSNDNIYGTKSRPAGRTAADKKLLEKIGVDEGSSSIREQIMMETETQEIEEEEKGYFESLFSKIGVSEEPVVDAAKEKQRLEDNDSKDLPPTSGETPTKKVKKSVF